MVRVKEHAPVPTADIITNVLSQHIIVSASIVKTSTLEGPENDVTFHPCDICGSPRMFQAKVRQGACLGIETWVMALPLGTSQGSGRDTYGNSQIPTSHPTGT